MPVRGVKPLPTAAKILKGTINNRPQNYAEPQPEMITRNDIPPELEGNTRAMREWVRLIPLLRACRQISEADRTALISLCVEWAIYLDGVYSKDRRVALRARQALGNCLRLWPELGLTPSSRSRVKTVMPAAYGGADRFSEFDASETSGEAH